jgi:hypothetical protein
MKITKAHLKQIIAEELEEVTRYEAERLHDRVAAMKKQLASMGPGRERDKLKKELEKLAPPLEEGRPPMGVLMDPALYDLVPVKKIFGFIKEYPDRKMLASGDMVQTAAGDVMVFVGMDENNEPILTTEDEYRTMYSDYLTSRERHES